MNFRTTLYIPTAPFSIAHEDRLMCIGSCFADNISTKLEKLHFKNMLNPFGILYNPVSIYKTLNRILNQQFYTKNDLFQHNGHWHSFDHHSQFSHQDYKIVIEQINAAVQQSFEWLDTANRLIITLGTAHVYQYIETDKIVANCHKVPSKHFNHFLLRTGQICDSLSSILNVLKKKNADLEVIFTVSPIRHIRLGMMENQRSKATLLLAIHQLVEQLDFVHYFPAYELVLDDLRDYRFYKADMIHPNSQAIDYVWEHFSNTHFEKETLELNHKIEAIQQASQHRSFHPSSDQHQQFLHKYLGRIDALEAQYSFLKLDVERVQLGQQLINSSDKMT